MTELATALDALARAHGAWVRLHYVYPYPHVDDVDRADDRRSGRGRPAALPRRAVPAREPAHPEADEAPGQRRGHAASASRPGAPRAPTSRSAARSSSASPARPSASSTSCSRSSRTRSSTASAASPIRRSTAPRPTRCPTRCPTTVKEERRARFMAVQARDQRAPARAAGRHDDDGAGRRPRGRRRRRSRAARPTRPRSTASCAIANGGSLAVGSFARVTVTAAGEHDLTAQVVRQPRRAGAVVDKPSLSR